jgi:ubiquinone/menaquinone biosynthesis C-methylase UbiE
MLSVARRRIVAAGWTNVEVYQADTARFPFPDGSFDMAICTFAMNIIPECARAVEEVYRVLVPGGRFINLEMKSMRHGLPKWLQALLRVAPWPPREEEGSPAELHPGKKTEASRLRSPAGFQSHLQLAEHSRKPPADQ